MYSSYKMSGQDFNCSTKAGYFFSYPQSFSVFGALLHFVKKKNATMFYTSKKMLI